VVNARLRRFFPYTGVAIDPYVEGLAATAEVVRPQSNAVATLSVAASTQQLAPTMTAQVLGAISVEAELVEAGLAEIEVSQIQRVA